MAGWFRVVCFVWVLVCAVSCGKKEPQKEPAKAPPAEPVKTATPEAEEAEIRSLFGMWQRAQTQGAFKEYEWLYAAQLYAERPDGTSMRAYDRVSWMRERGQLMAVPATLTIKDARMMRGLASMFVDFEQVYDHQEFKENGKKRLIFVREGGNWKISYEVPEPVRPLVETPGANKAEVTFVVHAFGKNFIVLAKNADPAWASEDSGAFENVGSVFVALAKAGKGLPEQQKALLGKAFDVLGDDGRRCQGKVQELAILTGINPPQVDIDVLTGKAGPTPKPADAVRVLLQLARESDRLLVGEIKGCDGTIAFAPGAKVSGTRVMGAVTIDQAALAKAIVGVPALDAMQTSFSHFYGGHPPRPTWFNQVSGYAVVGQPDLAVIIMSGIEQAHDWYGSLTLLVSGVSKNALRVIGASPFDQQPLMLLEVDQDGTWEIYTRPGEMIGDIVRPSRDNPAILALVRPSVFN